ncbi:MAG: outer membrane protein assembly factor BamE [Magnetococcales bacterium]|nr:outer membrane protein assembly factor BamE [Magnetococcales bacterium]
MHPLHRSRFVIPFLLGAVLAMTGCQAKMQESGVILNADALNRIQIGASTRSQVLELLGPPTLVNSFRGNRWLYIQDRKFKNMQRTFSRVANRVEITFDANGVVEEVKKNFDEQVWDPTKLPEAKNEKGWVNWIWDRSYNHPATNPHAPPQPPPAVAAPEPAPEPEQSAPPKKSWWKFWSSGEEKKP